MIEENCSIVSLPAQVLRRRQMPQPDEEEAVARLSGEALLTTRMFISARSPLG